MIKLTTNVIKLIIKIIVIMIKIAMVFGVIIIAIFLAILLLDRFGNEIDINNVIKLFESPAFNTTIAIIIGVLSIYFNQKDPVVVEVIKDKSDDKIQKNKKNKKE